MDVDKHAVAWQKLIYETLLELMSPGPLPIDFFEDNLAVGDFLQDDLKPSFPDSFSLIVGNPPYVSTDRISPEDKGHYRSRYPTAFGRIDLYTLFMGKILSTRRGRRGLVVYHAG